MKPKLSKPRDAKAPVARSGVTVRLTLVVAALAAGLVVVQAPPAAAEVLTETFHQMNCNANIHNVDANNIDLFVSCQLKADPFNGFHDANGDFDVNRTLEVAVRDSYGAPGVTNWISGSIGYPNHYITTSPDPASNQCASVPGSYRLRCHRRFNVGGAYEAAPQASLTGAWGTPWQSRSARWQVTQIANGFPDWPTDYYPGGSPPAPPTPVPTPAVVCTQEFFEQNGTQYVRVTGAVTNPTGDATDTLAVATDFATGWTPAGTNVYEVPAITTMPTSGWRGLCKATRTVTNTSTHAGSLSWQGYSTTALDAEDPEATRTAPFLGWATPPTGIPTMPWVITTPKPAPIGTPLGANVPTVAGVAAAAVVGWTVGGAIAGKLKLGYSQEWYCRWNPGYALANQAECAKYDTTPDLRTATQLKDINGNAVTTTTTTAWKTAVAVAEVVINPTKQWQGQRTVTATEAPTLTPTEQEQLAESVTTTPNDDCDLGLLGLLNPFNLGQVLRCSFVPRPEALAAMVSEISTRFPINIAVGAATAVATIFSAALAATDGPDPCLDIPIGSILNKSRVGPALAHDFSDVKLRMPTPSDSGCPGLTRHAERNDTDNLIGDVFGYRTHIRTLMVFMLWLSVAYAVIRSVAPAPGDLEMGTEWVEE